jgi:hypothetical protein
MKTFLIILASGLLLVGCSEQPTPTAATKKEEAKPEPITGQSALFKMVQVARSWAPDATVLKLTSTHVEGVADQPGKSGGWSAVFVSAERASSRSFTWYAVDQEPTIHKGVFPGAEESYSHGTTAPFAIGDVKIDSVAALDTAKVKEADYEKKNPGQPVIYLLEKTTKFPNPAWRVIWGDSVSTSGFSGFVDATTGTFLQIMH